MTKKYRLNPGYVISESDGDRHYINSVQLAQNYGVKMAECVLKNTDTDHGYTGGLVDLWPRSDGDYTLPKEEAP